MTKTKLIILIAVIVVIIIAAVLLIWWFTKEEKPIVPTKTAEQIMREEVEQEIEEHDFSKRDFETIDDIKTLEEKGISIVNDLISSDDKKERYLGYVAISGLALEDEQKQAELVPLLKQGLTDSDTTIKVQVAQLLLNFGEKDAFPVLINVLDSNETMVPSEPIMTIAQYSYYILTEYTEQDYGMDKTKWQNWWQTNGTDLQYDSKTQIYK